MANIPKSPRQKMINLMYIVLTAMLALNVSSDVLNGFKIVEDSLKRTIGNSLSQNVALYAELTEYYHKNTEKTEVWFLKGKEVHSLTDSLYQYIQSLKVDIVKEADGKNGDIDNIEHVDDLEASNQVMLAPGRGEKEGRKLKLFIDRYKNTIVSMINDTVKQRIILNNLNTEPSESAKAENKNWEESWFENMPVAAATTLLSKLQSDILYAEGEVLHTLLNNIDVGDFRVNRIKAYVIPNSQNVIQGSMYSAHIVLSAEDSTQRPSIFINDKLLPPENMGLFEVRAGSIGNFPLKGFIEITRSNGGKTQYPFEQSYTVVAPMATVSATMMNVLYAAIDNPIEISVPGLPSQAVSASSSGNGTLTPKGNGQWVARPAKVGADFVITVTAQVDGRNQVVATKTFKVRPLPDPKPFIEYADENGNVKRFAGGNLSKALLLSSSGIKAAIDDGLLNIEFQVSGFEIVFFDSMGNAVPEVTTGSNFSDRQKDQMRRLSRGKRFYVSRVKAVGPDGERQIQPIEVIIN
ncbi:MAG: gliding motility protein GldM [Bacteroidales bacterium]|jgi:gliding motility-associated protein GldM|nr:gliding motility protein GldM [Bacteroidales bacterium]